MVQFAEAFPEEQIVVTLSRQLGWSHFVAIIPLDEDLKRDFYAEMCRIERWSTRTLEKKISSMLFDSGYAMRFALCSMRRRGGLFDRTSSSKALAEEAPRGDTSGADSFGRKKRRTRKCLTPHDLRFTEVN